MRGKLLRDHKACRRRARDFERQVASDRVYCSFKRNASLPASVQHASRCEGRRCSLLAIVVFDCKLECEVNEFRPKTHEPISAFPCSTVHVTRNAEWLPKQTPCSVSDSDMFDKLRIGRFHSCGRAVLLLYFKCCIDDSVSPFSLPTRRFKM